LHFLPIFHVPHIKKSRFRLKNRLKKIIFLKKTIKNPFWTKIPDNLNETDISFLHTICCPKKYAIYKASQKENHTAANHTIKLSDQIFFLTICHIT
jgi:hypothetical protein